eukprot:3361684-Ditylum_brightwellii.AAC.1
MVLTKALGAQPKKSSMEDGSIQKEKQPDVKKEDDTTAITKCTSGSDEAFNWKDTLRNCPEAIAVITLENTT